MSGFSVSSPPPRLLPLAPLPTPLAAPLQGLATGSGTAPIPAATSGTALATGYTPAAPTQGGTAETPARTPAETPRETGQSRTAHRLRDPALAGPPPAFQTNLLDLRNDLETLVRDMDAARAAEARILYGAPPPPRAPGLASSEP